MSKEPPLPSYPKYIVFALNQKFNLYEEQISKIINEIKQKIEGVNMTNILNNDKSKS